MTLGLVMSQGVIPSDQAPAKTEYYLAVYSIDHYPFRAK